VINRLEGFLNKSRARRLIAALSVTAVAAAGLVASNAPSATAVGLAPVMGIASGSGILWESNADFNRDMDAIAATGAAWIRVDFDWSSIQYESPTTWRWDRSTDRIVAGAQARGLKVLGQLGYSPPWARPSDCPAGSNKCIPNDVTAYGNFVRAAAERYGARSSNTTLRGSVTAWEIWNEPNHGPFAQPKPSIDRYSALLIAAYPAIKAADPGATVVTGGLSPAPDAADGTEIAPTTFLAGLYARGARGYFDAVGHHPYSYPYNPLGGQSWNAFTQTASLYQIMTNNSDSAKKIWGTEAGAPTGTDAGRSVSEAQQAQFVSDYYRGWSTNYGAFTGPLFWHQHRDSGSNPGFYDDNFGLLRRDFSQKPSYAAYQAIANGASVTTTTTTTTTSTTTTTTLPPTTSTTTPPSTTTTTTPGPGSGERIAGSNPIGWVESLSVTPSGIRVQGWTIDPDRAGSIDVLIWMEGFQLLGRVTADDARMPLDAVFPAYGPNHGFDTTVAIPDGVHNVCALAVGVGVGTNTMLSCRDVWVTSSPFGFVETATSGVGGLNVTGWSIDGDSTASPAVHIWMDGTTFVGATNSDQRRADLGAIFPAYGDGHGFSASFTAAPGLHSFCMYALNAAGRGTTTPLGCRDVFINTAPIGSLDTVVRVPGGVRVGGWAIDPETVDPIFVHIYVDSDGVAATANARRQDVGNVFPAYGNNHGFDQVVKTPLEGPTRICAWGINAGPGSQTLLGCRVVNILHTPIGSLDTIVRTPSGLSVNGWAIDPDTASALTVHVYVDGVATVEIAGLSRPDLAPIFPAYGKEHGFSIDVSTYLGPHTVCVYAINQYEGVHSLLGCRSI